ncbi:A24 family peptidase [Limobrevibacterium gyesilva]|uniref:A24 family peptidase n=1 Tax=Limobrevibacterium gyesilva TaxID=2991712 RepID=A0AA41YL26_9PROT|nr:A24 family peptidase [Limobrevibacterium gyesilva]MCW3475829.1 A24 family peptidase [Limobrevibacterium gyesilva]
MTHDAIYLAGQITLTIGAALLIVAALHDVAARTIPNWTCLGLAVLGLVLRGADGQLLAGLALGVVVFLVATFCWTRGWMGGGDVKLLAAAAIFVPPADVGNMLVAITLAGGVVGLFYLGWRFVLRRLAAQPRPRPSSLLARILRAERWRILRGCPLPYASAIAAGTLFVIVAG